MRRQILSLLIMLFCIQPIQALPENITQTIAHNAGPFALHLVKHVGWGLAMHYAATMVHELGHGAASLMSGTPFKLIVGDSSRKAFFNSKHLKITPSNPFNLTGNIAAIKPLSPIPKRYEALVTLAGPLAGVILSGTLLSNFIKKAYMNALTTKPHDWPWLVSSNTLTFQIWLFILLVELANLSPFVPRCDGDQLLKSLGVSSASRKNMRTISCYIVWPSIFILPLVLGKYFADSLENTYQA